MQHKRKFNLMNWLRVFLWLYFTGVFAWALAHLLLGDHPWWMFAANALSFYFFLPLPVVVITAFLARRREIWAATALAFLLALFLYGPLYRPWRVTSVPAGQALTVMTYNVLGYNRHPQAVVDAILASGADVVALQELNPSVAKAIQQRLSSTYPYQEMDARDSVFGSGVISRYPMHLSDEKLPGTWVGTPQILSLIVGGKSITLLNAHVFATNLGTPEYIEATIYARERQARAIVDFVGAHPEPVIVPADFNSTAQNSTYPIVTSVLSDAWMEAGWGPGYSFPGLSSSIPTWAIRIDYIFYSHHFSAVDAQIGPWDGYSDHRPVLARLVLTDDSPLQGKGK